MKVKISNREIFFTLANCAPQKYYSLLLTPKLGTERKTTLLTNGEVHKFIGEKPTTRKCHQLQENN